jgi:hypothetical protein
VSDGWDSGTATAAPPSQPTTGCIQWETSQHSGCCKHSLHILLVVKQMFHSDAWNSMFHKSERRERKQRAEYPREDFHNAPWQVMLNSGDYRIETTKSGRNFRRKYRLSAPLFDFIVATVLHRRFFPEYDATGSGHDAFSRPIPSLQVKILIVFRLLGSGCEFAAVYDGGYQCDVYVCCASQYAAALRWLRQTLDP